MRRNFVIIFIFYIKLIIINKERLKEVNNGNGMCNMHSIPYVKYSGKDSNYDK